MKIAILFLFYEKEQKHEFAIVIIANIIFIPKYGAKLQVYKHVVGNIYVCSHTCRAVSKVRLEQKTENCQIFKTSLFYPCCPNIKPGKQLVHTVVA